MSNKVFSGDFLKVLLALKESIMKDIHCSELAIIKEVFDNNCNCSLLSNPDIKINAYRTKGTRCRVGDIVLVAFSDNDFRSNLVKKDNNAKLQAIDSTVKHQLDYGIIISNLTIGTGGTNVSFVDNKDIITQLSTLYMNRLSDEQLNELIGEGNIIANSLYMTPDVSEDETKANVDASNLSNANVTSWKNKCGFEKTEVIYNMNSSDPNINWGYTGGITVSNSNGASFGGKDFSKYKYLDVYYIRQNAPTDTIPYGFVGKCRVDLQIAPNADGTYGGLDTQSINYTPFVEVNYLELMKVWVTINAAKTDIWLRTASCSVATPTTWYYDRGKFVKIEGVY